MGLLNQIKDNFTRAEFKVLPDKQLKTISAEFEKAFGVQLVFYKGRQIADGELTLEQLNERTRKEINLNAGGLKIKASMRVGEAEDLFDTHFGIKVQIKKNGGLAPNNITIGAVARGEY
jgi:hypothetical protein